MSIFTTVINAAVGLYKNVKGGVKFSQIIGNLYSKLPEIVTGILAITGTDDKEKIIQAWEEFDLRTGIEAGAVDVFRDIPPEDEEVMMDGFKSFGLGVTLWAGGFYGSKPTQEEFNLALSGMPMTTAPAAQEEPADIPSIGSGLMQQLETIAVVPEKYSVEQKSKVFAKALIHILTNRYV